MKGGVPTAELLIRAGADINQIDQNELTPLYLAIMNSTSNDIFEFQVEKKNYSKIQRNLLHALHLGNSLSMLELLINKGANVNYSRKSDGMSPLSGFIAAGYGKNRSFQLDLSRFE